MLKTQTSLSTWSQERRMKWLVLLGLVAFSECIVKYVWGLIPLRRVKTMRNTVSGKKVLNNFLKEHAYRLSQISFRGSYLTSHPLRNIRDLHTLGSDITSLPPSGLSIRPSASSTDLGELKELLFMTQFRDKQEGSVVMFGGVDHRYYEGELNWVSLIKAGDWSVHMDRISMKRKAIACSDGCKALVDTGTSDTAGQRKLVNNIQKLIGATPRGSKYYISCSAVNTLPSIIFTINGINYPVPARAYILKDDRGRCYTNFKEHRFSSSTETWILGAVFLRLYFSVFDQANDRIGLARAV
ncbi:pregnancy-associated glycoprotein 1-like isoform X1 [Bubalus bubalis]|uniref:pregnancy-associated glycoprotein 1-like isoform X1 n=1 Tax=Bubalus bubalis TaxID=89462 RepID=UPI001E1B9894|nr:pregnancy-associated glycoprotein 1-like isoform X1 [Bubalus bubalis]